MCKNIYIRVKKGGEVRIYSREVDIFAINCYTYQISYLGAAMIDEVKVYEYILAHIRDNGYQPSMVEIASAFNTGHAAIYYHLNKIAELGVIKRGSVNRAIEFVNLRWEELREIEWDLSARPSHRDLLELVRESVRQKGYQPTTGELSAALGISTGTVGNRIKDLVRMGVVENKGSGRALKLIGSKWYPHKISEESNG